MLTNRNALSQDFYRISWRYPTRFVLDNRDVAHLLAEFFFGPSHVALKLDVLGQAVSFKRGEYQVEFFCPRGPEDLPKHEFLSGLETDLMIKVGWLPALRVRLRFEAPMQTTTGVAPTPQDALDRAFIEARSTVSEFISWTRLRGQVWLDAHPSSLYLRDPGTLKDEETNEILATKELFAPLLRVDLAGAVDKAFFIDMTTYLGDGHPPLRISEILLADALQLAGETPPELEKGILIAAMACETEVKRTLRTFCDPKLSEMVALFISSPRDWSVAANALFDSVMKVALGVSLREENKGLFKRVQKLFEHRNAFAHSKDRPPVEELQRSMETAQLALRLSLPPLSSTS